jgi:hypothetical protein
VESFAFRWRDPDRVRDLLGFRSRHAKDDRSNQDAREEHSQHENEHEEDHQVELIVHVVGS